jgi:hypothetical protein
VHNRQATPTQPVKQAAFSYIGTANNGYGSGWIDHDKKMLDKILMQSAAHLWNGIKMLEL